MLKFAVLHRIGSVSYTHLDVYKRQVLDLPHNINLVYYIYVYYIHGNNEKNNSYGSDTIHYKQYDWPCEITLNLWQGLNLINIFAH